MATDAQGVYKKIPGAPFPRSEDVGARNRQDIVARQRQRPSAELLHERRGATRGWVIVRWARPWAADTAHAPDWHVVYIERLISDEIWSRIGRDH